MVNSSIEILASLINLLLGFFSTFIIFDFLGRFKRNKFYPKYVYVIAYIIFTVSLFGVNIILADGLITLGVTFLGTVSIGYFLYNREKIAIIYYSIYVVALLITQSVVSLLFNLACARFAIYFYSPIIYISTLSLVIQFSYLGISRLFIIYFKNKNIKKITRVQYFNFLVMPLFSIIYIMTLMMYLQTYIGLSDMLWIMVNILSIIILNIFITNIFESISKNNELKSKLILYEEQSRIQYEYYSSLENNYKNSRKVIHDIKNHLQTIENLYKSEQCDKGKTYTDDMYKLLEKFSQKQYAEHRTLNLIINDKMIKANKYNIDFICKVGEIDLEFIKDIDLTTIFANLLDNAIDETSLVEKEKKITLKIDSFNNFIIINIINSLRNKPQKDKNFFKSTKKNHSGFGLENVSRALEKYEGNMRIDFDDREFKVNIIIPINN